MVLLGRVMSHHFKIPTYQFILDLGFCANYLKAVATRPCGIILLAKGNWTNASHVGSYCAVISSVPPIISFFGNQGDKSSGDGFQSANECLDDGKIYPTLKVDGVITPFVHKQQSLKELFGNALDSRMGCNCCGNCLLGFDDQLDHRVRRGWIINCATD